MFFSNYWASYITPSLFGDTVPLCPGWLWTIDPPASDSQSASILGISLCYYFISEKTNEWRFFDNEQVDVHRGLVSSMITNRQSRTLPNSFCFIFLVWSVRESSFCPSPGRWLCNNGMLFSVTRYHLWHSPCSPSLCCVQTAMLLLAWSLISL